MKELNNINQNNGDQQFINEINRNINVNQINFINLNQNPSNIYNSDNFRTNIILD